MGTPDAPRAEVGVAGAPPLLPGGQRERVSATGGIGSSTMPEAAEATLAAAVGGHATPPAGGGAASAGAAAMRVGVCPEFHRLARS